MGDSNWVYTLTHYDKSNSFATQDITGAAVDLKFDDIVNEVMTAQVLLSAENGFYMRDERAGESGFPTKIDKQDRIRIISVDGTAAGLIYDEVFDVIRKTPIKSEAGTMLRLEMKHIGRWLDDGVPFVGRGTFETPSNMWERLGIYYNDNKGTDHPLLDGHLTSDSENNLPDGILDHFDFGNNEEKVLERMRQVSDQMGAAGGNGGVLDFFDFKINAKSANVTEMTIDVRSSGSRTDGSEVTIDTSTDAVVNSGETDGGEEEFRGNITFVWGANDGGSLPIDYSRFKSRQVLFPTPEHSLFAEHVAGTYEKDSIVRLAGVVYTNSSQTSNTPPTAPWSILTTALYYGNVIQYSPWTDDKVALWKNSGGDPEDDSGSSNYGPAMPDINIIINDDTSFATWVDIASLTDAFDTDWKYGHIAAGEYEGLRCLVNGAGADGFSGNDPTGLPFTNSVAEFTDRGDGLKWYVKYAAINDMFVYSFRDAALRQFDSAGGGSYTNVTTLDNGSHCNHPYTSMSNAESIFTDENGTEYTTTNANSSIEAVYDWTPIASWAQAFFNLRTNADYFRSGGWLVLRFPFPKFTGNSIGENLGELYGGGADDWVTSTAYVLNDTVQESGKKYRCEIAHTSGTFATDLAAGNWVQITDLNPTHIDAQNMTYTHDGHKGLNFGLSSDDYGAISAVDFYMKIVYSDQTDTLLTKGNFKMRCWMVDKNDHAVFQDFVISHNDNWQSVSLPLSGFQIYRGRRPTWDPGIITVLNLVVPQGLDANEQFEWRHVAMVGWQTQESYDDFGRYQAGRGDFGIANIFTFTTRRLKIRIDAVRFKKPLLVNTGTVTDNPKITMPFPEAKDVIIFDSLEQIAFANNEKNQFEKVNYEIETSLRHDILAGDFFFLLDSEIVDKSDDSTDNKVKLVAKQVEYFIKGDGDSGGATRLIRGSRRFV